MTVKDDSSLGDLLPSSYKISMSRPNQKQLAREIGLRLKAARKDLLDGRLSQREAGERAGFGEDSQSRVSNYESGRRNIVLADLLALADVYKKSPVFLTFGVRELPIEEERLLEDFRKLPSDTQRIVRNILDAELRAGLASERRKAGR